MFYWFGSTGQGALVFSSVCFLTFLWANSDCWTCIKAGQVWSQTEPGGHLLMVLQMAHWTDLSLYSCRAGMEPGRARRQRSEERWTQCAHTWPCHLARASMGHRCAVSTGIQRAHWTFQVLLHVCGLVARCIGGHAGGCQGINGAQVGTVFLSEPLLLYVKRTGFVGKWLWKKHWVGRIPIRAL